MNKQEHEDVINNPSHYTEGLTQEVIVTIVEWLKKYDDPIIGYLLGTHLKYIPRANVKHKDKGIYEDMNKANFYWEELMEYLKSKQQGYTYVPKQRGGEKQDEV